MATSAEATPAECTPEIERTILVIGSGLAGLATAIGLANAASSARKNDRTNNEGPATCSAAALRTTIEVIEKRPVYDVRGAAFGLAPNGMKALKEVCPEVAETLAEEGIYMGHTGGHLLPWFRVRDALLKHAQSYSKTNGSVQVQIRFRMGWTLDRIEQGDVDHGAEEGSVTAVRAYFTNGEVLEGSLLIAADGIHSKVRILLGLPPALQPPASRVWRGHVQVPEDSVLYPHITNGEVMPLGSIGHGRTLAVVFSFHEKKPGAAAWTVSTKDPGIDRNTSVWKVVEPLLEASKEEEGGEAASSLSPNRSESKAELFCELLRLTPEADLNVYDNTVVPVPDDDGAGWGGTGRVVLVGDAAHAMRPASGVGGAMAFEDAQLLCRKLTPWMRCESGGEALPDLLRDFENERLVRVRRIWHMEWSISEAAYNKKPLDPASAPDEDYKAWLYAGI